MKKGWHFGTVLCILLFVISMVWINFHAAHWSQMDCYTYVLEGKLMHDARSFFPPYWYFGNQYHIVSSPNLAAVFYGITHNSMTAMALASSAAILVIALLFVWCFNSFTTRQARMAGLLCILGGVIFGTDAAMYVSGLQVLYTMSSFYACYLAGILLTLGIWLRLQARQPVHIGLIILSLLLNFALGMQSLREMLILAIPLVLSEFVYSLHMQKRHVGASFSVPCLLFVFGVFLFELAGHFYMESLHVTATPIIEGIHLDLIPSHLLANLWASTKNLLRISGLAIAIDGLRYLPLSICALFIAATVFTSIFLIIKHQDQSTLAKAVIFSLLSVLCVYGVGIFFMRTRDIYYFVYWLLAALSIVYLLQQKESPLRKYILPLLLPVCCINYCFTFIPNFEDYAGSHKEVEAFTQSLVDRGISVIYTDSSPIFAAGSDDHIITQAYWLDYNMTDGYPLSVFPSDKYTLVYEDTYYDNALICMSDYYREAIAAAPEAFRQRLFSNLEYFDEITVRGERLTLYRSKERVIHPFPHSQAD